MKIWIKCSCGVSDLFFGSKEEAEKKMAEDLDCMSKATNPPVDMSKHVMKVVETDDNALTA